MKINVSQNIVVAYDGKRHTFRAGAHEVDDKLAKKMIKDGFAKADVKAEVKPEDKQPEVDDKTKADNE